MALSQRKGSSKVAAAATACQQWKVGDLVLAKVKGFPAWPAKMDRYQRAEKPKANTPIDENEIQITSQGRMRNYITYDMSLLHVLKQLNLPPDTPNFLQKGDIDRVSRLWEILPTGHKIGTLEPLFKELV